jgi:two-component system sensor histidine kinase YesM
MLGALSFMMRYSVKTPSALVPLSQDLAYIDSYIVLMKLRGGNDFTYEKEVDDALMDYQAPKFLLQPFVENAILHGFSADGGRHLLRLTGHIVGQSIVFTVEDNGCGMDSKDMETLWRKDAASIGISNTDRRIRLYYGDAYGVTITSDR